MPAASRRFLPLVVTLATVFVTAPALAGTWTTPTSEELQMTAAPAAPGAAAICLLRDERADDKLHIHTTYIRIKILTEKGKEYADHELSYEGHEFEIHGVEGRTIHSDGTVIPFTGKPYQKLIEKAGKEKYKATVFTLPDVQVGSILEFRYTLGYGSELVVSPRWYLQSPLYVRNAHFEFLPSDRTLNDGHGGVMRGQVAYSAYLPPGASIVYSPAGKYYTLDVEKIPAEPEEEFMPPMHNYTYRALFYYTVAKTTDEYWNTEGKYWSKAAEHFIDGGKLAPIESQIVASTDTPEQKLKKLYAATMKIENTSFTRERSGEENKAEGVKVKTAADIWAQQRGNRDEITRLFVGLARAAGFKAYVGVVTNRDRNLFLADYLNVNQLDDDIAIVQVDGKDQFFDPGERYAEYGRLHWKHSATQGIRETEHGTSIFLTPVPIYQSTNEVRDAYLEMEPDGKVNGTIRITLSGSQALNWRQYALSNEEDALKEQFEKTLQQEMPDGVKVKVDHFLGLTDWDKGLQVMLKVTGSMGTATSKRVFLPATFFAATSHPLFALDKRTLPVDLDYPYAMQDVVQIKLPPALGIESLPKDEEVSFPQNAIYRAKFTQGSGMLKSNRVFVLGNVAYKPEEYPELKSFYQKVNAKDKESAVLQFIQASSGAGATPPASNTAGKAE